MVAQIVELDEVGGSGKGVNSVLKVVKYFE